MTAITFPANPSVGQVYTATTNNVRYTWDGSKWKAQGSGGAGMLGATGITGATGVSPGSSGATGNYEIISSNLTLYVATTGNDSTGTGTSGSPWATPHKAMSYLRQRIIADDVTVTVSVADGAYTFTTPIILDHPQGRRITITGGTTTGTRPTTGLNGNNVRGRTAGTLSYNDTLLNAYYNTRWQFNGCAGLICSSGSAVTVNKVLIRGNGTGTWVGVMCGNLQGSSENYAHRGAIVLGNTVAVHNFYDGISTYYGGSIYAPYVTSTCHINKAINTNIGGAIDCPNAVANNNAYGIITDYGGSIFAGYSEASCNSVNGYQANFGGSIYAQQSKAYNNTNIGMVVNFGGSIYTQYAICNNNGVSGVYVYYGGSMYAGNSTMQANGYYGVVLVGGGTLAARSCTSTGNGVTNVYCLWSGHVEIDGTVYDGSISPALNTVGNGNAYISG